jgi:TRAP-type C4-dicarboxylate transport system substrate-binding protein
MIPKPLQLLFEAAAAQYSYDQYAAFQKADMDAFEKLQMEQGVEIIRLNESDVEKFKRFAPAMWAKWAKKSPLAMKAFESQLAFLKSENLGYITEEGLVDLDGKKLVY